MEKEYMEDEYGSESDTVTISLNTGKLQVNRTMLKEFATLVINHLYKTKHEYADLFADELKMRSFINWEGNWQINVWHLMKSNKGELELVRCPPRSEVMYFFVAYFKKVDDTWFVSNFSTRKMWGRLE